MLNLNQLETGVVYVNGRGLAQLAALSWQNHPKFAGVAIKNILMDEVKYLTMMLVKLEPGHEISLHVHEDQAELHQILEGDGTAVIDQTVLKYSPGTLSLIPSNIPHQVKAGEKGLLLMAAFTPQLNA
ncbi:MAG TPA: cupin domain-containing protein [Bacillota bacterium]|nr:cupin domain-containing protein [Bacillota bacterium]